MRIVGIGMAVLLLAGCVSQGGVTRSQASAKVHTELAALYYERAQLGIALDELRQAMTAEPDYAPAYNVRGLVHMALREDKEAEEDFQHSLSLDNINSEARNNYGWFLCQRGRAHESVKQFLAALKNPLYSTPEKAYLNAGVCSQKAGEMKDAEEFLQKALLLKPEMPEPMLGLAELSFANGDYVTAKSYFTRFAQSNAPITAENLWLAVRIERKLGDRNAEDSYALQLRKRFPDARETLLMQQAQ
ncbi:MAG: type IV pilus biogenesis/stability protein PilW [Nitrosomonadales bacterium]|nr:type IV pilus biogenesis/stability protein PilW [Nitrosomonadales bacterium]